MVKIAQVLTISNMNKDKILIINQITLIRASIKALYEKSEIIQVPYTYFK